MARVTVTNNQSSQYFIPSPVASLIAANQTESFDGISIDAMEQSDAFVEAVSAGTITVTVSQDPNILDEIEVGGIVTSEFGTLLTPLRTEEWTDPDVADVDAIKLSIASAASEQTYSGAALDGAVGTGLMSPPRNMTITSSLHADIDAVAVVITGLDIDGNALSDTITLTDGGGATDEGTACFARVSSIVVPAQSGTGGALEFGFGDAIGLAGPLNTRAGAAVVVLEIEAGSVVTTGTFADGSAAAPHGSYTAANAPDGSRDYAVMYEVASSAWV